MNDIVDFIRKEVKFSPKVALILGSGLGDFADELKIFAKLDSTDIPGYPKSSVEGHAGKLFFGRVETKNYKSLPLLVFKGRIHFYEWGQLAPVVLPVQIAHALGATRLLVTNAAGGINRNFQAGDLMIIRDILSLTFERVSQQIESPGLSKKSVPHFDPERISLRQKEVLSGSIQSTIRAAAKNIGMQLKEGTYCWLKGPTYETAAEIDMLHRIGVDAIGMSTVPEISTARNLGMEVGGLSLISNLATGISPMKLSHEEVTETAARVKKDFTALMKEIFIQLK